MKPPPKRKPLPRICGTAKLFIQRSKRLRQLIEQAIIELHTTESHLAISIHFTSLPNALPLPIYLRFAISENDTSPEPTWQPFTLHAIGDICHLQYPLVNTPTLILQTRQADLSHQRIIQR